MVTEVAQLTSMLPTTPPSTVNIISGPIAAKARTLLELAHGSGDMIAQIYPCGPKPQNMVSFMGL